LTGNSHKYDFCDTFCELFDFTLIVTLIGDPCAACYMTPVINKKFNLIENDNNASYSCFHIGVHIHVFILGYICTPGYG